MKCFSTNHKSTTGQETYIFSNRPIYRVYARKNSRLQRRNIRTLDIPGAKETYIKKIPTQTFNYVLYVYTFEMLYRQFILLFFRTYCSVWNVALNCSE